MNRLIRLRTYLENYEYVQPDESLRPGLEHAELERSLALRRIHTEDVIAPGLREDAVYRGRFNLTHEDLVVLGQGEGSRSSRYTFATSWSNYLRSTCKPKQFHCFLGILLREDCVYLYSLEHKTLPGREDIHEDDAKARPLEVCVLHQDRKRPPWRDPRAQGGQVYYYYYDY